MSSNPGGKASPVGGSSSSGPGRIPAARSSSRVELRSPSRRSATGSSQEGGECTIREPGSLPLVEPQVAAVSCERYRFLPSQEVPFFPAVVLVVNHGEEVVLRGLPWVHPRDQIVSPESLYLYLVVPCPPSSPLHGQKVGTFVDQGLVDLETRFQQVNSNQEFAHLARVSQVSSAQGCTSQGRRESHP